MCFAFYTLNNCYQELQLCPVGKPSISSCFLTIILMFLNSSYKMSDQYKTGVLRLSCRQPNPLLYCVISRTFSNSSSLFYITMVTQLSVSLNYNFCFLHIVCKFPSVAVFPHLRFLLVVLFAIWKHMSS